MVAALSTRINEVAQGHRCMVARLGQAASTGPADMPIPSGIAQISAPQIDQPIMELLITIYKTRSLAFMSIATKNSRVLRGNSSDTLGVVCGVYCTPRSAMSRWYDQVVLRTYSWTTTPSFVSITSPYVLDRMPGMLWQSCTALQAFSWNKTRADSSLRNLKLVKFAVCKDRRNVGITVKAHPHHIIQQLNATLDVSANCILYLPRTGNQYVPG